MTCPARAVWQVQRCCALPHAALLSLVALSARLKTCASTQRDNCRHNSALHQDQLEFDPIKLGNDTWANKLLCRVALLPRCLVALLQLASPSSLWDELAICFHKAETVAAIFLDVQSQCGHKSSKP